VVEHLLKQLKYSYEELSFAQKKVAKVFFEEPKKIAFTSAFEIGRQVEVSESTVIRLTQKLGYKGYTEVQQLIQKELSKERVLQQHKEISSISNDQSIIKDLMKADMSNIQMMMQSLDEEKFIKSMKTLNDANKVYITGNLLSHGLAQFFTQWMNMILGNTELLTPGNVQYFNKLSQIDENSVLVAIIFPRYMKSTVETVEQCKNRGAQVIAITDSELSPVAKYTDLTLTVPIHSSIKIDSYTAVMSLLTSLMRCVSVENQDKAEINLKKIEEVYEQNGVFYRD
jgi:DNA-binding MurR/RpiR family transcriptional regulator